jgi:putative ABC transport system ATP-binding protein
MEKPVIELQDVWKIYKMGEVEVPALGGVSLRVERGEFLIIVGPSGSGKSTMMNLVGCLDLPTKGEIFLDGQDIAHLRESQLAEIRGRTIGFVFQEFNLLTTLDAISNVTLPLEFQNVDSKVARKRGIELLEMVGLGDRIHHLPTQLSGGERQRVSIARALSVEPDIILADEPTGNLDSKTGQFIMDSLKRIQQEKGKTIIVVTHDLDLIKAADRVVYLKDGKIEKVIKCKKNNGEYAQNRRRKK